MRAWLIILAGMVLWTAHFFALYIIASLFPGQPLAHWLVLAITLVLFAWAAWLLPGALAHARHGGDGFDRWLAGLRAGALAIAMVAIAYQGAIAAF